MVRTIVIGFLILVLAALIQFPLFFKVVKFIEWSDCPVPEVGMPDNCPKTVSYELKRI